MLEDWAQMSKMLDFNLTPTFFEGGGPSNRQIAKCHTRATQTEAISAKR